MYQLIIFDWDGTLMDSAQKIVHCLQAAARDIKVVEPADEQARSIIGLGLPEATKVLFPDVNEEQARAFIEAYKFHFVSNNQTEQRLFSGVKQGLDELNKQGALLAVATGKSRAGLQRIIQQQQMESCFVATRCADETRSKPHPQMLLELLEQTAIDADKAVMIGDTSYDMQMAQNAGVAALGVSYGVHSQAHLQKSGAKHVLHSFQEVIDWLGEGRVACAYE